MVWIVNSIVAIIEGLVIYFGIVRPRMKYDKKCKNTPKVYSEPDGYDLPADKPVWKPGMIDNSSTNEDILHMKDPRGRYLFVDAITSGALTVNDARIIMGYPEIKTPEEIAKQNEIKYRLEQNHLMVITPPDGPVVGIYAWGEEKPISYLNFDKRLGSEEAESIKESFLDKCNCESCVPMRRKLNA